MKFAAAALLLAVASPLSVFAQTPTGSPIRVSAFTTVPQENPTIARAADGHFVIAWNGSDGDMQGVVARRFDAAGAPIGGEFVVNSYTTGRQRYANVAMDPDGRFLVAWASYQDGSALGVFAQRHDASGARLGQEFRVNSVTTNHQNIPAAAALGNGRYVVTWSDGNGDGSGAGTFALCYDAGGTPESAPFLVNAYTTDHQAVTAVAADGAGNFVVAWQSYGQDGSGNAIVARRFNAACVRQGTEFVVNSHTTGYQNDPSIGCHPAAGCVIAWHSTVVYDQYSGPDIRARRFDPAGAPLGGEFPVNRASGGGQRYASVAVAATGDFVVGWQDEYHGARSSELSTFSQRFDPAGTPRGAAFHVNTSHPFSIQPVALVAAGQGRFAMVYDADGKVFLQLFGALDPAALAVDGSVSPGSNGNHVLEPGETADLAPSWRNVTGSLQFIDGTGLGFTGPLASGISYILPDATGAYGAVADGSSAVCTDCYRVGVQAASERASPHWDAAFTERLSAGAPAQDQAWSVHLGDSFGDVPRSNPYYRDIETLFHRGTTAGCAAGLYCPSAVVSRGQMAAFVQSADDPTYLLLDCPLYGVYADVPFSSPYCKAIQALTKRRVVSGCGGSYFCPSDPVTREQMAVFLLRTVDSALVPPPCTTPVFPDVPAGSPYCPWIEELARRGITAGCGGGNYCPSAPVTREQMATFLTGTFGLRLYGP